MHKDSKINIEKQEKILEKGITIFTKIIVQEYCKTNPTNINPIIK
jgi:hypothetical protein